MARKRSRSVKVVKSQEHTLFFIAKSLVASKEPIRDFARFEQELTSDQLLGIQNILSGGTVDHAAKDKPKVGEYIKPDFLKNIPIRKYKKRQMANTILSLLARYKNKKIKIIEVPKKRKKKDDEPPEKLMHVFQIQIGNERGTGANATGYFDAKCWSFDMAKKVFKDYFKGSPLEKVSRQIESKTTSINIEYAKKGEIIILDFKNGRIFRKSFNCGER